MSDLTIHLTAEIIGEADSPPRDEWQAAISPGGVHQIKSRLLQIRIINPGIGLTPDQIHYGHAGKV